MFSRIDIEKSLKLFEQIIKNDHCTQLVKNFIVQNTKAVLKGSKKMLKGKTILLKKQSAIFKLASVALCLNSTYEWYQKKALLMMYFLIQ